MTFPLHLIQTSQNFHTSNVLITSNLINIKNVLINIASYLYRCLTIFNYFVKKTFRFIFINGIKELELVIYKKIIKYTPVNSIPSYISLEKILLLLIISNIFIGLYLKKLQNQKKQIEVLENHANMIELHLKNFQNQKKHIEILENDINYIKKYETINDSKEIQFINDIKNNIKETEKKMSQIEKKIRVIEKEQKTYM